ncbi:hypothetical protein [Clostridium butyricum]|uniref:hypothetical protein n=1 Tax=Clostridium butyricum TaxID=1492 RepID=UPI00374E3FEB
MKFIERILKSEIFWHMMTIITSFLVVKITLVADKRKNNENLEISNKQHREVIEEEKKLHNESLELEKRQVRANLLPFLILKNNIKLGRRGNGYTFPLKVTNIGNGAAFDIRVDYVESQYNECYVYKEDYGNVIRYYEYSDYLYKNCLTFNDSANFEFILNNQVNGVNYSPMEKLVGGKILFKLLFKDAVYNQYEQEYMIKYSSKGECGRIESYLPKLVNENK